MLENAFLGLYNLKLFCGLLSHSGLYKSPSSNFRVSEIFCGPLMCWYYRSCWPVEPKVKIEPSVNVCELGILSTSFTDFLYDKLGEDVEVIFFWQTPKTEHPNKSCLQDVENEWTPCLEVNPTTWSSPPPPPPKKKKKHLLRLTCTKATVTTMMMAWNKTLKYYTPENI